MKKIVFLFLTILYMPIILMTGYWISGTKLDVELEGYSDAIEKPAFSIEDYIEGTYQASYSSWKETTFLPRGVYITAYNTLQYNLFNLGNRIVGKNKDIFEIDYINAELCIGNENDYSILERRKELEEYVNTLNSINDKLDKIGKKLFIYITPSKANVNYSNIPYRYIVQGNKNGVRSVDYLIELLNEYQLPYLNSSDYLDELEYPAFYTTGIHWSRTYEQIVNREIIQNLTDITGKKYRGFEITGVEISDEPFWRDSDVFDLLNVWNPDYEDNYYQYLMEIEVPEEYDKMNMLLQGGSFADGLRKDILECNPNENLYYVNYDVFLQNREGVYTVLNGSYDKLPLTDILDEIDCVVIELNEAVIHRYSNGFVNYLNNYLNDYSPSHKELEYVERLDFNEEIYWNENAFWGLWWQEDGYVWSKADAEIRIKNSEIANKGMQILIDIPQEVFEDAQESNLLVYVNGRKMFQKSYYAAENEIIIFDSEQIQSINDDEDVYVIDIFSDTSFVPAEQGINEDSRELSFKIKYIGEPK